MSKSRLIVALDYPAEDDALELIEKLDPGCCRLKIGKELFTRTGPEFVKHLSAIGFDTFLDLKFHDIPNTVAKACKAAGDLGVWMLNVHALGGLRMMIAAREAVSDMENPPLLVAVTLLTSIDRDSMHDIGLTGEPGEATVRLATLAKQAEMDGVVCSPVDVKSIRDTMGNDFCLVTPGIRPVGTRSNDQIRVASPCQALESGADYLVIGRPITAAPDPAAALAAIQQDITSFENRAS